MKAHLVVWILASTGCNLYFADRPDPGDGRPDPPPTQPPVVPTKPPPPPANPPPSPPIEPIEPPLCEGAELNVFSIYETHSNHSYGNHPGGYADVFIDRPGVHTLVFAAYEPTKWTVTLTPGASVDRIFLFGYHTQYVESTADLANVEITTNTFEQGGLFACGYSLPYDGEGCDTNQLLSFVQQLAGPIDSFHGCYHASEFTLNADQSTTSNCARDQGYLPYDLVQSCASDGGFDWQRTEFQTLEAAQCTGTRYVRFDERYDAWVGAILCGSTQRYKLYMAASLNEPFLQIADYAGHGQDHCELVNPTFTIPDEDDITSGGCASCAIGNLEDPIGVPVYARALFGEPFERVISRDWADLTSTSLSCGVAIR